MLMEAIMEFVWVTGGVVGAEVCVGTGVAAGQVPQVFMQFFLLSGSDDVHTSGVSWWQLFQ